MAIGGELVGGEGVEGEAWWGGGGDECGRQLKGWGISDKTIRITSNLQNPGTTQNIHCAIALMPFPKTTPSTGITQDISNTQINLDVKPGSPRP